MEVTSGILFLLIVMAFFVAAEFATVAVKNVTVESLANRGDYLAKCLLPFVKSANNLDRYVSTCQIVTTVCSLVLGSLAEKRVTPAIETLLFEVCKVDPQSMSAVVWKPALSVAVVILFTVVQLVISEIIPKAVAVRYMMPVAKIAVLPVSWILKTFGWLISIFNKSSAFVLRCFGVKLDAERHAHSAEELSSLVEHTDEIGELEQTQLERVLRFNARCVRDIMVPRNLVQGIDLNIPRKDGVDMIMKSAHTRFPVYKGSVDNILGIMHIKDYLRIDGKIPKSKYFIPERFLKKVRPALFCPSSLPVDRVLEKMREERVYMAILIDEYGGFDGVVTIEDIIESVLGEIHDEFDVDSSKTEEVFREVKPGEYAVSGPTLLDNLSEDKEIALTVNDKAIPRVHTVGGLVMHLYGGVPTVGTAVSCDNYTLTVTKMERHQVVAVRICAKKGEEVG